MKYNVKPIHGSKQRLALHPIQFSNSLIWDLLGDPNCLFKHRIDILASAAETAIDDTNESDQRFANVRHHSMPTTMRAKTQVKIPQVQQKATGCQ